LPADDDSDLTRVRGRESAAKGQVTELVGRLLDANGNPLVNTRIEIWQCDANGRYRHPHDRGGATPDLNFQGHGFSISDAAGRYRFRTIRPVPYPGRTPHIHMAVFATQSPTFVTQLYIAGESRNTQDFLFNRIPVEKRERVVADFVSHPHGSAEFLAQFDIVIAGTGGTPAG
jgi:protocatechuate 3,4-dioxygenase beta subunit